VGECVWKWSSASTLVLQNFIRIGPTICLHRAHLHTTKFVKNRIITTHTGYANKIVKLNLCGHRFKFKVFNMLTQKYLIDTCFLFEETYMCGVYVCGLSD